MFVSILKFIHLLFALGLLGLAICCLVLISSKKSLIVSEVQINLFTSINKIMLGFALFAALTGTLLVYPKHFTFHTPWVIAAYLLVIVFCLLISVLLILKNKQRQHWLWWWIYTVLPILLIVMVHDAVTKSTFLF